MRTVWWARTVLPAIGALLAFIAAARLLLDIRPTVGSSASGFPCPLWLCTDEQLLREARRQARRADAEGRSRAVKLFRQATNRAPASPYRWCDLGEALADSGDMENARRCFERAEALGPNIPPILLRISSFHLRAGERPQLFARASRILALIRDYDGLLFSEYRAVGASVADVLRDGIPRDRAAGQSYFRDLLAHGSVSDLEATWTWLTVNSFADDPLAGGYVSSLMSRRQFAEAAGVWARYTGTRRGDYLRPNLVFNGGFESEFTGVALDWRLDPAQGVEVRRDPEHARSGAYALRIRFDGCCDLDYRGVLQTAVANPGRYRFDAKIRAEDLTTDSGIYVRIFDPEAPSRLDLATDQVLGTTDWVTLEKRVTASPQTRLLAIQISRRPSFGVDSKIAGVVWIDNVSLVRVPE